MHHHHKHLDQDMAKRAPVPELTTQDGIVMSVVYVTAEPTFTGVIGSYSTVTDNGDDTTSQQQQATAATSSPSTTITLGNTATTATQSTATSSGKNTSQASNSIVNFATLTNTASTATTAISSITAISSTFATSASGSTRSSSVNTAVAGAATTDSSATSSDSTSSTGMSTGAKAGLAIAIILIIGAVAALCLFLLGKKRKQRERQALADNEKNSSGDGGAVPAASSSPVAPRLSLRPVSRLVPEMIGGARPKSRLSQGNMLTTFNTTSNGPAARNLSPAGVAGAPAHRAVTQPTTIQEENPFQDPQNPFADPEKSTNTNNFTPATVPNAAPGPVLSEKPLAALPVNAAPTPVPAPASVMPGTISPNPLAPIPAPLAIPAVDDVAPGAPSPVVAQGPGPEQSQSNVYRVLMDFNPTMGDELGLRAGQHVRMLHEYDDGWALCIKLDRSQQGVVPRTCLANKPSKPRPTPASNSPRFRPAPPMSSRNSPAPSRPITPVGPPSRVASPPIGTPSSSRPASAAPQQGAPAARPMSPGAFNQAPRPLSPGPRPQKRSMSPGPYGASGPKPMAGVSQRRRSNSANALSVRDRRNSPPGPSKLGPGLPTLRADSPGPDSPGLAM